MTHRHETRTSKNHATSGWMIRTFNTGGVQHPVLNDGTQYFLRCQDDLSSALARVRVVDVDETASHDADEKHQTDSFPVYIVNLNPKSHAH